MPGVPTGLACDACRKSKKRCDLTKPTCLSCKKRGIPCVGMGVIRWKFVSKSQESDVNVDEAVVTAVAAPKPRGSPSNDHTRMVSSLIHILTVHDVKYDTRAIGGNFVLNLPRMVGDSKHFDAAISALVASYNAIHQTEARPVALLRYGAALEALRKAIPDPNKSVAMKIFTIVIVTFCQDWIDSANRETASHKVMISLLLREALENGTIKEIDRTYIYALCQSLIIEAWINPTFELGGWFWDLLTHCSGQRPHPYQQARPFMSLDVEIQAEATIYFRNPARHWNRLHQIYELILSEKPHMLLIIQQRAAIAAMGGPEAVKKLPSRVALQIGHAMMILFASGVNHALRSVADDPVLVEDMHGFCDEVIQLAEHCVDMRPIGTYFVPRVLEVVWACMLRNEEYGLRELEYWMTFYGQGFEGADYVQEAYWMRESLDFICGMQLEEPNRGEATGIGKLVESLSHLAG